MIGKDLRKIIEQWLLMFCFQKKEKIYPAYVSKHNSSSEGWHYLAVKKLSSLLRGITSKQHCKKNYNKENDKGYFLEVDVHYT